MNGIKLPSAAERPSTIEKESAMPMAEMFNLFNHPNFANPVGYLDSSDFGRSTSTIGNHVGTGTSRQAQLALKMVF
jgi:hypothetical protein